MAKEQDQDMEGLKSFIGYQGHQQKSIVKWIREHFSRFQRNGNFNGIQILDRNGGEKNS